MKITKEDLKKIIKEEISSILLEAHEALFRYLVY